MKKRFFTQILFIGLTGPQQPVFAELYDIQSIHISNFLPNL